MNKSIERLTASAFAALLTAAFPAAANAQDSNVGAIEEIVVTAQKRVENLQEVPLSITAFSAEMLETQRISTVQEVAALTPNFTYSSFAGNRPEFTIRGIGTAGVVRAGLDNDVVMFVDEVYISRSSASYFELFDLEQVLVLRGPQGTLFGKNVVGGAISITTKKPNLKEMEGKVRASVGDEGYTELKGYISGPLGEGVAGKLSFSTQSRDGFGRDLISGQELDDLNTTSVRGQVYFSGDATDVYITADYSSDETNGKTLSDTEQSPRFAESFDNDPRTSNHGVLQGIETDQWGISAKLDRKYSSGTWTTVAAYRDSDSKLRESFTAATVPALGGLGSALDIFEQAEVADQLSLESRYASSNDGTFNWVGGLYLISEDITRIECEDAVTDADAGFVPPFFHGGLSDASKSCWDQNSQSDGWAVFVDGTFDFDNFVLRIGGRYTTESKESRTVATAVVPASNLGGQISAFLNEEYDVSLKGDFDGFTPRVVLEWHPSDRAMYYVSAARGYKAGGFDGKTSNSIAASMGFENEFAWTYELGAKTQFANDTVRLNAAVFHTDFDDLQQLILTATGSLAVVNAAEATIEGFELEATWVPTDHLYISAGFGYLDAVFDEYVIAPFGFVLEDRTGNDIPNAPDTTWNLNVTYDVPMTGSGALRLNASVADTASYFGDGNNNPLSRTKAYTLVNASAAYTFANDRTTLSLWGKNLGDEEYENRRFSFLATSAVHLGAPRLYGLSLTHEF